MSAVKHSGFIGKKATRVVQRGLLTFMVGAGLVLVSSPMAAHAQSTSASIVGHAPAGDTIVVKSAAGTHRSTKVKDNGRYAIRALPVGVYTVELFKNGEEYDTRYNIGLRVGASFKVDFPCKNDHCAKD